MRNPGAAASLMDDVDFIAELEKFDANPIENERIPSAAIPAGPDAAWTRETRATFDERPKVEERATFDEPELPPENETSATRVALGVAGFLLMMCLGGAAAALMLHDRIAQILRWVDNGAGLTCVTRNRFAMCLGGAPAPWCFTIASLKFFGESTTGGLTCVVRDRFALCLGGAAAALMFHDRIAQILRWVDNGRTWPAWRAIDSLCLGGALAALFHDRIAQFFGKSTTGGLTCATGDRFALCLCGAAAALMFQNCIAQILRWVDNERADLGDARAIRKGLPYQEKSGDAHDAASRINQISRRGDQLSVRHETRADLWPGRSNR